MPEAFIKNIINYVWEQGETFDERPLNRVDSLVFSQLCYFQLPAAAEVAWGWEGLPIYELWRSDWLDEMTFHMYDPEGAKRLAAAVAASPRFRNVRICAYVMELDHESEMQFSATTYLLESGDAYVAFRGTDNTVVGWKENLNLAVQVQVPSQIQAMQYVDDVAAHTPGGIWVGGHSKGGNLAMYVSAIAEPSVRGRLLCCFSHDGPGFNGQALAELGADDVPVPVDRTLPKSSIFGMLFEQYEQDAIVVRSSGSGFAQHDPLSWEVEGCDFVQEERLGRTAAYVDSSLNAWIERSTLEERKQFVEAVFAIMMANEKTYTHEIRLGWRKSVPTMARAARDLDPEMRDVFVHKIYELIRELGPGASREARERSAG